MKYTTFVLLLLASLLTAPAETFASASPTKDEAIFKRKKKGYRKKKGFMWGLFKKKDCGCPKF